jgi:hypothetical protein
VVAVGASNLTRGFHAVVVTARAAWGRDVEVVAALGHGRLYGGPSTYFGRLLPGILDSGLWRALDERPARPARALVTDVGNDLMSGYPPDTILQWIDTCVARLQQHTRDIVLTGLPHAALAGLPAARYLVFRTLFFPRCRFTLDETLRRGAELQDGLRSLARERGATFFVMKPDWYGIDPIHIRPSMWRPAWQEILCGDGKAPAGTRAPWGEALRLYWRQPERVSYFGRERRFPQRGVALRGGGKVWLY